MLVKKPSRAKNMVNVTFQYPSDSYAESVNLVGEFNDWDTASLPCECCRSNAVYWEITLALPEGRRFSYRFLVNGQTWVNDARADDYAVDDRGNTNSVVIT